MLGSLKAQVDTMQRELDLHVITPGPRGIMSYYAVQRQDAEVRREFETLTNDVERVNGDFARLFDDVNVVQIRFREPKPRVIAIDLRTGAGTNRSVFTTLSSVEHYVPYRFDVPTDVPAAPLSATQQGSLFAANPNAAVVVTTSNATPVVNRTFDFELHRMWDATVTGGFFGSSIGTPEFGTRPGTSGDTVVMTGRRSSQIHFAMGITWFPGQEDTYPDTDFNWRNRFGLILAAAVDAADNYYLGWLVEPRSGINVSAGMHLGRQTALQDGYVAGRSVVASGSGAPTTSVTKVGFYLMAGLDLNIFRAVFGGTPSVPK